MRDSEVGAVVAMAILMICVSMLLGYYIGQNSVNNNVADMIRNDGGIIVDGIPYLCEDNAELLELSSFSRENILQIHRLKLFWI